MAKIKVKVRPEIPLPVGLHKVMIEAVNFARNSTGNLILRTVNGTEYPVIEITFCNESVSFKENFATDPSSQWIWDNLSKALHIDNRSKSISAKEAKGIPLYIIIAAEAFFNDSGIMRNPDGSVLLKKRLRMKFYEYSNIMAPLVDGDPKMNNGVPSGLFLMNEGLDLNQYMQERDIYDEF